MKISIINGPNLNLLGKREPEIYGSLTFEAYFEELKQKFPAIEFNYYQSNIEGELIDKIQEFGFTYDGNIRLMAEAFSGKSIRNMYFNHRSGDSFYRITNTNRSMGVSSGI